MLVDQESVQENKYCSGTDEKFSSSVRLFGPIFIITQLRVLDRVMVCFWL